MDKRKVAYHKLKDEDSDSEVDIYDATATQRKSQTNMIKKIGVVSMTLFLLAVTTAVIVISVHSKSAALYVNNNPIVTTDCGSVSGVEEIDEGKKSFIFKGIPYAVPPVGNLRWTPPVRLSDGEKKHCWKGVYPAHKFRSKCVQGMEGFEDCLYLNVYTPTLSNTSKLPVFVWIHGGYLLTGYGNMFGYSPSGEFIHAMGVVAVSMNYRLNAFGFLTLRELWQKDKCYGNYGFMDQILVLKWVQSNIANFGGDPNSVTICGQSSGGTSIFGLLASPLADGLFHKAIPMSGSPKFEKSYINASKDNSKFIKNAHKCSNLSQGEKLRSCLYHMSAKEVTLSIPYETYPNWGMDDLLDFPTYGHFDGALAVVDPVVVVKPIKELSQITFKNQHRIPVLIGNTAQEIGFQPVKHFKGRNAWTKFHNFLKERLDDFSPNFINLIWGKLYKNKTDVKFSSAQMVYETLVTDVRTTCPLNQLAEDFSKSTHHDIYRYVVEHAPYKPIKFGFNKNISAHAFHVWDAAALFNFKMVTKTGYQPRSTDFAFRDTIRRSFKNFIKNGKLDNWRANRTGVFKTDGKLYIQGDYHENKCKFWNNKTNGFVPYAWINQFYLEVIVTYLANHHYHIQLFICVRLQMVSDLLIYCLFYPIIVFFFFSMKRNKYDPLPQFSESDSDIDIFNAKSSMNYTASHKQKRWGKTTKLVLALLVIIASVSSIIVAISLHTRVKLMNNNREASVIVYTECGPVLGYKESAKVEHQFLTTYVFKGIPYAKPPIGDLRWTPPVRLSLDKKNCWNGIFNASTSGNKCVQSDNGKIVGSENCLYLNVHTPAVKGKLPVFVWIFGGYLTSGFPNDVGYSPDSEFVASMNVVSVSMNYRLNAFGFLTLRELRRNGTDGNYGFMDQILALKWVQSNIKNFGGDPNSVTICGQSSGGTSIFGLLASPLADGLFHKAISMSGSPKFEKSYVDAERDNRVFINKTKCITFITADEIRSCLYNLTSKEVFLSIPQNTYPNWGMLNLYDFPTKGYLNGALAVVDGNVVVKPPKELANVTFKSKKKVAVLVGSTAQEIAYEPAHTFEGVDSWNKFRSFLKNRLDNFTTNFVDKIWGNLYKNQTYRNGTLKTAQYLYETISADVRVTCPTNKLVHDFQKSVHHTVYRYIVTHSPYEPIRYDGLSWFNAFHAWDSHALFGLRKEVQAGYKPNSEDKKFMKSIRTTVLQFMKEGSINWTSTQTGVFNQDGGIDVLKGDYHEKQCEFWNTVANGFVPYAWIN
ncbi:uncharacterized protein LOC130636827 [Hydractinia symbiolongicarpus]|uniref:uncharacterized protein LOC130636827 n=1 Tax=Hydractinia symbiolongicarpus TaxID=13093 RepID=UPI00254C8E1C|nr:uncharacterized protein LOC130636827 [Hydractinia symbiolongicarpus]